MTRVTDQLWASLQAAGVVQGDAPVSEGVEAPWYVKTLVAFSGWLAALFMLGFIGAGLYFVLENSVASLIVGGIMLAGSYAVLRMPSNDFLEHLALAVSLAGQALVVWALFKLTGTSDGMAWILTALLQTALAIVMPNFVHRVFSALFAATALAMALAIGGVLYIFSGVVMFIAAWLWLNEFRFPLHIAKVRAIGYGLVLALIQVKGFVLFGMTSLGWRSGRDPSTLVQPWVGELLAAAVTLYVVWQLLQRRGQAASGRVGIAALAGTLLLCLASMEARGITVGMVIILLGFAGGNRVLTGLGIACLLFFVSSYYYLLDVTLLAKAQTLFVVGVVLLMLRWLMLRVVPKTKEAAHV